MRLFLGIEIPTNIKDAIHHHLLPLQKTLKGWENPYDYHQTLLFIGEASSEDLDEITRRLKEFSFDQFKLTLTQFEFFNRRIMYLAVSSSAELLALKKKVDESFPEWLREDEKPFLPHITVKRWQRYEYEDLTTGLQLNKFQPQTFLVSSLSLFKSDKDQFGRKYHVLVSKEFL